ncbi:related to delta3,5-delta2,4-dienoyl-coa isomerase precursor [Serendipita indica DSM 11827]|uniref:Related to delta3,5-delta2,4-dienoyl-coa isomerase n=1 Tax=Serendipita indica (strain DSM 11827) TaxID=1109443 RepID=G4T7J0_SERID|nr:related to delta3,5-delta2,4-dienoyl-coa isomerase precursor [Serendipita indica DSM 11827]
MSSYLFFKVSVPSEGVLLVEMNRPPVNAFNQPFWEEMQKVFEAASKDGDIRVVVLASALPQLFTAGLDLKNTGVLMNHGNLDPARHALRLREHILVFQAAISSIEKCLKPVIAACHGLCLGLAIDILCATDVRYAASSSSFSIKEVDVGLAADIGTLSRMPKIVGNMSLVREWAFSAKNFSADEALQVGFVSKVVQGGQNEVVAAAIETAKLIASKSPIAVLGTKHLLLHAQDHSVTESLEYTATWNQAMLQSDDTIQAFRAALSRTQPKFAPLPKL